MRRYFWRVAVTQRAKGYSPFPADAIAQTPGGEASGLWAPFDSLCCAGVRL